MWEHSYMLCVCPSLRSFWNAVFLLLSGITGCITKPTPTLAILCMGIERFPLPFRIAGSLKLLNEQAPLDLCTLYLLQLFGLCFLETVSNIINMTNAPNTK